MGAVRPEVLQGRPVPLPPHFAPSMHWADGTYIYHYDAACRIAKRTPLKAGSGHGSQFFAVTNRAAELNIVAPSQRRRGRRGLVATAACLVVMAVAGLAYPWMPEVGYHMRQISPAARPRALQSVAVTPAIQGNRLLIPKIGVDTPILEGSDLTVLDRAAGVWHQAGPLGNGNFVLAGHRFRYLPPNTSTLYSLHRLAPGDPVAVDWQGKRTVFRVSELRTVAATEVSVLLPTPRPRLTIYTCTDVRESQRTVLVAEPLPGA